MPTFRHGLCKIGETYQYCFRVRGQQFKGSTRATDRSTAERVLQEKRREAVLRLQTGYVEPPTVAALLDQWVAANQQVLSPAHILNTRRLMAKWVLPTLADTRIDRVKTSAVMGIRSRVLEAGRTLSTANLVTRTIKLLWNFALRLDYLEKLPFQIDQLRVQKKPRTIIPAARVPEFLAKVDSLTKDPQKRVAIRIALFCASRPFRNKSRMNL